MLHRFLLVKWFGGHLAKYLEANAASLPEERFIDEKTFIEVL